MKTRISLLIFLGTMLALSNLSSQNIIWDGGGDGESWFQGSNWNLGIVPTSTHDVIIDIPANITIQSVIDTAFANSIKLDGSGIKLSLVDGLLILESTNSTSYCVLMQGDPTFNNGGRMYINRCLADGMRIEGGSFGIEENDTLKIFGVANNASGQGIEIETNGFLQNKGYLFITGAGENNFEDGIVSEGGFNNTSTGVTEIYNIEGNINSHAIEMINSTLTNSGVISIDTVENGSGIIVTGATSQLQNFGGIIEVDNILNPARSGVVISGGATLTGFDSGSLGFLEASINAEKVNILNPGSKISPGPLTRKLSINGDLIMGSGARFVLDIAGAAGPGVIGGNDYVTVYTGTTNLDNNDDILDVNLIGGYLPGFHEKFLFLDHNTLLGEFLSNNIEQSPAYSDWIAKSISGNYTYQLGCVPDLEYTCTDIDCPITSSSTSASNSMDISGPYEILSGDVVSFSAPSVQLDNGFTVDFGAVFEITQTGCIPD